MSSPRATLAALGIAALLGGAYYGWVIKAQPARAKAEEAAKKLFDGLKADATQEVLLRKTGSPEVLLRKIDGHWRLLKPVQAPADPAVVDSLLTALGGATREEVVVEKDAELRQYGLDQPSGAVSFVPASPGAKAQVLFFGSDNPTGQYAYGMIDGKPQVFLTWLSVKGAVLKSADDLRDKSVWSFEPGRVKTLQSSQGRGFSLERDAKGAWTLAHAGQREPALASAVNDWLDELARLKALSVPSEDGKGGAWGLSKGPHLHVQLEDGSRLELHLGGKAKPDGLYAQAAPGGPVFRLADKDYLTLSKEALALADRKAFAFEADQVERFEVIRPEGHLSAVKQQGSWAWVPAQPAAGKEFDFGGFVSRFANAELIERLSEKDKPKKAAVTVSFYGHNGVLLDSADFGPKRGQGRLAISAVKHWVSVVADNLLDGLPSPQALSGTAK